jgi:hypothetical protein
MPLEIGVQMVVVERLEASGQRALVCAYLALAMVELFYCPIVA